MPKQKVTRAIAHLDADCFYVSAERVRNSFLVGKPVGVLGNQGACVIAKSYEMKAMGIKTATAIWEAMRICPNGVYIKRDFHWYEVVSRQMLTLVREASPKVEYYSIDEFFFEVEATGRLALERLAQEIRDRIWHEVRVPVTIGIARSRTLAKLISDSAKPFGVGVALGRQEELPILAQQPITEITGFAERRAKRLQPWGIQTCLELARADRRLVRQVLTVAGESLWWELNGEPIFPIQTRRIPHKTLSRGGSFGQPTNEPATLFAWLVRNLERLIEELQFHQVLTGRLTVWVRYREGPSGIGQVNLTIPTDRFDDLLEAGQKCLRQAWIPRAWAGRMQILAEKLRPRTEAQLSLFDNLAESRRSEQIAEVKRQVNAHQGRFALRSAATLPLSWVYYDQVNNYDICDIRGKSYF